MIILIMWDMFETYSEPSDHWKLFFEITFSKTSTWKWIKIRFPAEGRTFLRTLRNSKPCVYVFFWRFCPWHLFETQNETERVYVPWAWMYKYIDFENAFWLQIEFYAPCFAFKIVLSDKHPSLKFHWRWFWMFVKLDDLFDCKIGFISKEQ